MRDGRPKSMRPNASNARQGIKTKTGGDGGEIDRISPNASNARQGIKTAPWVAWRASSTARPNASNARQGIKTKDEGEGNAGESVASERLQCPTGH